MGRSLITTIFYCLFFSENNFSGSEALQNSFEVATSPTQSVDPFMSCTQVKILIGTKIFIFHHLNLINTERVEKRGRKGVFVH